MKRLKEYLDNQNSEIYNDIKFIDVTFTKNTNTLTLRLNYKPTLDFPSVKDELSRDIKNYIGVDDIAIEYKAKKSVLDIDVLSALINSYLQSNYSSLYSSYNKDTLEITINGDKVNISLGFATVFYDYLKDKKFEQNLALYLGDMYFAEFNINTYKTKVDDNELTVSLKNQIEITNEMIDNFTESSVIHKIDITGVEKFIGEQVEEKPIIIKDVKSNMDKVAVCGTVMFITQRSFKSKKTNENGEQVDRVYYNFSLKDGTGVIHCVYFPSKITLPLIQNLTDGTKVVVDGTIDNYNDRLSVKIKNISKCELPEKIDVPERKVKEKKVLDRYLHISPEPYIEKVQVDMFSMEENYICDFLKNNKFVVFDLETTGLDYSKDEITDIGAVRLENGHITETFSTLVGIDGVVSEKITSITGITNEMLKGQLPIEKILPDFFKFVDGYILVGFNNIGFDMQFIYRFGRMFGYNFKNEQLDAMFVAQQALKGLRNYKLKTVAERLEVVNKNAHRALSDAVATAEVFVKLENILNPKA